MWNLKTGQNDIKNNNNKTELINTESRLMVGRGRGFGWVKLMKGVRRYKLPVIK